MKIDLIIAFVDRDKNKDDVAALTAAAGGRVEVRVVDFYSSKVEDLMLVAKHRVTSRPAVVFLAGREVRARFLHFPPKTLVDKVLHAED